MVEVRSNVKKNVEVVFDSKGNILSSDAGEFFDRDLAIKRLRQALSEKLNVPVTSLRVLSDIIGHFQRLLRSWGFGYRANITVCQLVN